MSQPISGDDYYAKIGPSTTQSGTGAEKKKIKIVAKKIAPHPLPEKEIPSEGEYSPSQAVLGNDEPSHDRTSKPEGGKLDLGNKFVSRSSVVFHTHPSRSALPGQQRPSSSGPSRPSFNRPLGNRPAGQFQRPGQSSSNRPGAQSKGNFRKPDAPKKNFKTTKRGAKHKLAFISREKEDLDTFRRTKSIAGEKQEKNIDDIRQTLVDRSGQEVEIGDFLTVKEFSDKIGIPLARIIGELMKNGIMVNINSQIDFDTCFLIAEGFNIKVKKIHTTDSSITDLMDGNIDALLASDDPGEQVPRPPIISVMGHVDHGKTSILDSIRKTDVAASEAGGITQTIGAYQVTKNGRPITFLDTPGHEAFALMRSRGAKLTDIIILVVAADEGLKPQTIESINLAKEAGVPVVVAINKIDKPGADPEMVKRALSEHELVPEDWGGETICVPCSAKTGVGIDTLLDMVLLVADLKQLKSHPTRPGVGTVIESHLDPGQ